MWFVQPKTDYVSQAPWKHADEAAAMSWQIRARNYDVFHHNKMLVPMIFIALAGGWAFSVFAQTIFGKFLAGGGMFIFGVLISMSMTHGTTILVYRFTDSVAEIYSWRPQIDSVKPVLKWASIILWPIVGVVILMDPEMLVTAIGPLGIGIMAWMMGSSEDYQKWQRNVRHTEFDWKRTEEIRVWRKRSIISLTYPWKPFSKNSYYRPRSHQIFCHPDELDERIQFFRKHLPDASYEEGWMEVTGGKTE